MEIKKYGVLIFACLFFMLSMPFLSASLEINEIPISSIAIPELNKPAIFNITITNNGPSDEFLMYSLAGIYFEPNETFSINRGATRDFTVMVYPKIPLKISPDYYSFEYNVKGRNTEQQDDVSITLVKLKDALAISAGNINPDSTNAVITIQNKYGGSLEKLNVEFSSLFFEEKKEITLGPNEIKKVEVALNQEKLKSLVASPYIVTVKFNSGNVAAELTTTMNFEEKEGILSSQSSEGIMVQRYEAEKKNTGNTKATVNIVISKNLFSALFTSFNIMPNKKEYSGVHFDYSFTKELSPNENLRVIAKTNWWILVVILLVIGLIWYMIDKYLRNKLVVRKSASFVRTRGGEFALRISLHLKARDFVERIRIIDRLPPMVKVFEREGLSVPDRIDVANRRLEWNIQALAAGEERTISYIIYSKIGVVGRFELPSAETIYEYNGKLKEAQSNSAFYSKGE